MTNKLTLQLLSEKFSIHSLPVSSTIPAAVFQAPIFFIAKTYEEISIVLPTETHIDSDDVESGWRALEVVGPLGFNLTGILSNISTILANEKISILAVSTFDTDYILVKERTVKRAVDALSANQHHVILE